MYNYYLMGKYRYKRLIMGVNNSQDIFHHKMNDIHQGCEFTHAYMNDLLMLTKWYCTDHIHKLELSFNKTVGIQRRAKFIQVSAPRGLQTPSNHLLLPPPYIISTPLSPKHRRPKPAQGPKCQDVLLRHRRGDRAHLSPLRKRFQKTIIT